MTVSAKPAWFEYIEIIFNSRKQRVTCMQFFPLIYSYTRLFSGSTLQRLLAKLPIILIVFLPVYSIPQAINIIGVVGSYIVAGFPICTNWAQPNGLVWGPFKLYVSQVQWLISLAGCVVISSQVVSHQCHLKTTITLIHVRQVSQISPSKSSPTIPFYQPWKTNWSLNSSK